MFYQADTIDSLLTCDVCKEKMIDPRILPCGKSLCYDCIDYWTNIMSKIVKCKNCGKSHEIPAEGFPKNLMAQKMLKVEAQEHQEAKNDILNCGICKNKIQDPRLLPCGESVCSKCTVNMNRCHHCDKAHETPNEGFPKVIALQKLLKLKDKEILGAKYLAELKTLLDSINSKKQAIETILESGDGIIRDHCDKVRNEAQLSVEQAYLKLDEIHKDFLHHIDQHEKQCQESFKFIQKNTSEFELVFDVTNKFNSDSNKLLKHSQTQIDETDLPSYLHKAHYILTSLNEVKDNLERKMFNECLLKFDKNNFNSSSIGKIVRHHVDLYFLKNFKEMRMLDLVSKINCEEYSPILQPFASNTFLLLYDCESNANALCVDRNGNCLYEKNNLIKKDEKMKDLQIIDFFISASAYKVIFIFYEAFDRALFKLRTFDENFSLLAEICLDKKPKSHSFNGDYVFILNNRYKNQRFLTVSMYNSNLDLIKTYGQAEQSLSFFFSTKVEKFLVSDKYFINILEEIDSQKEYLQRIIIVNRSTGLVESSFIIDQFFDQSQLYMDKFIITLKNESRELRSFSLKGDLLNELTLDQKLYKCDFYSLDRELCFVTEDNKFYIC
jgi:hypothetical protein